MKLPLRSLVLACAGLLAACGGGGGQNENPPPLVLVSSSVADGAVDAPRSAGITFTFSAPIEPSSASINAISLTGAQGPLQIDVVVGGAQVRVVSMEKLTPLAEYTMRISTALRGRNGQGLSQEIERTFTIADRTWGTTRDFRFDTPPLPNIYSLANDAVGSIFVAWDQYEGDYASAWSVHFDPLIGWSVARRIEQDSDVDSFGPQLIGYGNGNAVAVWMRHETGAWTVGGNTFQNGGWGAAQVIQPQPSVQMLDLKIAGNPRGDCVATWLQWSGTELSLWTARFSPDSGWGQPVMLAARLGGAATVKAVVDADGFATIIWDHSQAGVNGVRARHSVLNGAWTAAQRLDRADRGLSSYVDIGAGSNGTVIAVWTQWDDAGLSDLWSARYDPVAGWSEAQSLESQAEDALDPKLAVGPDGSAVAVWFQRVSQGYELFANRRSAAGWETERSLRPDAIPLIGLQFDAAVDAQGNALAVWSQRSIDTDFALYSAYATPGGGWEAAQRIATNESTYQFQTRVHFNARGDAIATWLKDAGGVSAAWSNQYRRGVGWRGEQRMGMDEQTSATLPFLAFDPYDDATAVWIRIALSPIGLAANRFE